jgi:hypothetical protein
MAASQKARRSSYSLVAGLIALLDVFCRSVATVDF